MQEGGKIFMKKSRIAGSGAGSLSRADGGKAPRKRALPCAPSRSRPMRESHCFYGAHTDPRPQGEGVRARGWKRRIVSGKMDEANAGSDSTEYKEERNIGDDIPY